MTRWRSVSGGTLATVCALLIASPGRGQGGPPVAVPVDAVRKESVQEHRLVTGRPLSGSSQERNSFPARSRIFADARTPNCRT